MKRFGIVFTLLTVISSLSWGLILTNANFDAQTIGDGAWSAPGNISGWDLNGGWSHAQNLAAGSITPEAQSGANTCGLNGVDGTDGGSYISQIVKQDDGSTPVLVAADKTYKVTVWVGRRTGDQGSFAGILKVYLLETSGAIPTNIAEATYDLIAQSQNSWTQQTLYLSTGSAPVGAGSQLRLMLRNIGNRSSTHWYQQVVLDNVTISDPYVAKTPNPGNGATLIPVSTMLSWSPPDAFTPTGYNVRIGTDPNMSTILATNTPNTTVDPSPGGDLTFNTKYYWRVDAIDPNNGGNPITRIGDVWTFTTIPDAPVITTHPINQVTTAGSNVNFSIIALNTTSYAWYKSADAVVGGDTPVGGNSSTLTLSSVQVADEAYYYCIATGPNGSATSNMATLGIKRKVAHWALDELDSSGYYADSSAEEPNHPADPNGMPAFVAGMVDDGVQIDPDNGWASVGTWNPSEFTEQITISLWAKWTGDNGNWQGLIGKRNAWGADTMMWQIEAQQGSGNLDFKNVGAAVSSSPLPIGEWEYVAVTFNGTTAIIYRNAVSAASGTFAFGSGTGTNLMIGASEKSDAGVVGYTFYGVLDDIQIYNYALSNTELVDMIYRPVTGKGACIETYASQFDFDGDCKVEIDDFAALAAEWLSCGLYPVSDCQL